jgi:hypothetical protein
MRNRLWALLAATTIVVAACGGSTGTPAPAATSEPAATSAPAETAAPTPAVTPTPENPEDVLFNYTYEPTPGTPGGSAVVGDWQSVTNLNNFYDNAFTTSQVLASTMVGLWETSSDGHWKP